MKIGFHIFALKAQRLFAENAKALSRGLEQLSSGRRILRPGDDLASFSIAQTLNSKIREARQNVLAINQANGILNTSDTGLSSLTDIVQRMRELALAGSNETLSISERSLLHEEFMELFQEYSRTLGATQFNGNRLLDGSFSANILGASGSPIELPSLDANATAVFRRTETTSVGSYTFSSSSALSSTHGSDWSSRTIFEDLDGDGDMDMISGSTASAIGVRLGNGDGSYGAVTTYNLLTGTTGTLFDFTFRIGDINGDGDLDLVAHAITTSGGFGGTARSYLITRLGTGTGTFSATNTATLIESFTGGSSILGVQESNLALGDVDNDGIKEINFYDINGEAISGGTNNAVGFYVYNYTGGSFSQADYQSPGVADYGTEVVLRSADLNGDGREDIISLNSSGQITVANGSGPGIGAFSVLINPSSGTGTRDYLLEDYDQDGDIDIIAIGSVISFLENDGSGSFSEAQSISAGQNFVSAQMADINNDGHLDLVLSTLSGASPAVHVYTQDASHEFSLENEFSSTNMRAFTLDNIDGDDELEFLGFSTTDLSLFDWEISTETSVESGIPYLKLDSKESSEEVLEILDGALDKLIQLRAKVGSSQQQLEFRERFLQSQQESLSESYSNIMDVDLALTISDMAQRQILQQAQIAAMTQANLQAQLVLSLFSNLGIRL